jgi:hypothetical protein
VSSLIWSICASSAKSADDKRVAFSNYLSRWKSLPNAAEPSLRDGRQDAGSTLRFSADTIIPAQLNDSCHPAQASVVCRESNWFGHIQLAVRHDAGGDA